jgi:type II secretory pathway pseudopilin PulG
MRLTNLKKLAATGALGLFAVLGTAEIANAQTYRDYQRQQRQIQRQQERNIRQQQKAQRQYQRRMYRLNNRYGNYQTDERGIQILRDAVNRGYQQGFYAGQTGRRNRNSNYANLSIYRSGNYGYNRYVSSNQYRYYFQPLECYNVPSTRIGQFRAASKSYQPVPTRAENNRTFFSEPSVNISIKISGT